MFVDNYCHTKGISCFCIFSPLLFLVFPCSLLHFAVLLLPASKWGFISLLISAKFPSFSRLPPYIFAHSPCSLIAPLGVSSILSECASFLLWKKNSRKPKKKMKMKKKTNNQGENDYCLNALGLRSIACFPICHCNFLYFTVALTSRNGQSVTVYSPGALFEWFCKVTS